MVEERAEQRDAGRDQLQVRAHVDEQLDADRGHLAVGVGGELDVLDLAPSLDGRDRVLAAVLGPAHGDAELARQGDRDQLFRVDVELRAERAADRRRDHTQLVLVDSRW